MNGANMPADGQDVEVRCHSRVSGGRAPSERSLHTCTLQSSEGCRIAYLYGGRSRNGTALDDMHLLDLEANYWSSPKPKGEKPAGRFGHTAASHGEELYFFGGRSKGRVTFNFQEVTGPTTSLFSDKERGQRESEAEVSDELLGFHTPSLEWREVSYQGTAPPPRYKHGCCLVPERQGNARMFIFGGAEEEYRALNDACEHSM